MPRELARCASVAALFTGLLWATPSFAKVGNQPDTPNTGAYVSQIDHDWAIVSVNTGTLAAHMVEGLQDKIHSSSEIWDLAEFACRLYDRTSVLLSHSFQGNQRVVTRIDYLFACAMQ